MKRKLQARGIKKFKCHSLHASLVTNLQNAAKLHAFTAAFCTMTNQRPPKPLVPPEIPVVSDAFFEEEKTEVEKEEEDPQNDPTDDEE